MIAPEDDSEMHKVKSDDPDGGFAWKHEDDITEEDDLYGDPSGALADVVGTRQANALKREGIETVEQALAYEGDLTGIKGVGDQTVSDLLDAAE